jgi:hypothetical protein
MHPALLCLCCCCCYAVCLQELHASSQAVGNASAQVVALQVLEAAVSEFSLVTASPIGLSWEYHENCRNKFEVSRQSADTSATGWETAQSTAGCKYQQRVMRCSQSTMPATCRCQQPVS